MRRLLVLGLALALGGCSLLPRGGDGAAAGYAGERAELTTWTVRGRILMQATEEAWHATLYWRQLEDRYRIRLIGPLGQGTLELHNDADGVTLRNSEGEEYTAADAETLMQDTLGWRVPVDGLRYWMVGRPAPGAAVARRAVDDAGRLRELEQAGWRIRYPAYTAAAGLSLPRKLVLETDRFLVRVVVSSWEPGRA